MKKTIVPNRNMIFLSIAIGWAIKLKFEAIVYAAHHGDHAIYPDCRPAFVTAMKEAAKCCDWRSIEVICPFLDKTKSQIVQLGSQLGVPFEKTWSCYKGLQLHCGKCGTCVERKEAFFLAKIPDPTKYAA